jgi:esterase/lipase superfamily enzyme
MKTIFAAILLLAITNHSIAADLTGRWHGKVGDNTELGLNLKVEGKKLTGTIYTSDGDKALGISEWLMGSLRRMGRVDQALLSKEQIAKAQTVAPFAAFVQVTQTSGFIGHSYFVSDPAVSSDLVAVIRYGLEPGDPGRPLEEVSRPFWKVSRTPPASE